MSLFSINQYQKEVENIIHYGGTKKETAIRTAFHNLLNEYAKAKGLILVTEVTIKATNSNKNITPDGTLKDVLRQDWGYWESKDESDKIDDEIKKKFDKGYPKQNILFEDSSTAVLIQNGVEKMRATVKDAEALHNLITNFVNYERPEVKHFRHAIELFRQDIPKVTSTLRIIIDAAEKSNKEYKKLSRKFLRLCHDSINPNVTEDDIREMIIQHILTEDVFNTIFDENQFHRENNIARELEKVIHTFFTGSIRKTALANVQHYYQAINAAAAGIADHHEKQKFLKVIYETFYKSYNPKAADRLGVVYTPNELVHFMIKSTDFLLNKHFGKFLEDKGVEILDPATGTGTFITDVIDYIGKDKLSYKYKNELHANEVAILPYYISNLNIEFTYTQKMGEYQEFNNLCFVDTLDNLGFNFTGKQTNLFLPLSEENSLRIIKQNSRKISVIIGNPPYNANQLNENENNKNREYPEIDKRIKDTFLKYSTAQKTKVYDMYARFYRWAFDRLQDNGIVAFITNRSFIDSRTFDGFRKVVQTEFDFAYIIDLGGDIRGDKKVAIGNVFSIQTGVAIMYLVKKHNRHKNDLASIFYHCLPDEWNKENKLQWLSENEIKDVDFTHIVPDKKNNWVNIADNDFNQLIPLCDKAVKQGKSKKAIFQLFSLGVVTNRDEWVFDSDKINLELKVNFLIDTYNDEVTKRLLDKNPSAKNLFNPEIKWTRAVKKDLLNGKHYEFKSQLITNCLYRPYNKRLLYFSKDLNEMQYQIPSIFVGENKVIMFSTGQRGAFTCLSSNVIPSLDNFMPNATQCLALYKFDKEGNRTDNITDWGLNQFTSHYKTKKIKKIDVFNYVYAVLHFPVYRTKYELNLKREFPNIPFYENFNQWSEWGQILLNLHINYETVAPSNLREVIVGHKEFPKVKLKADKDNDKIIIDENTHLTDIPKTAWAYKLGNRSALEWVLDQYRESKPKDTTVAEKFHKYKFVDYKAFVIELLKKVCTVSVETMGIIEKMNTK